MSDLTIPHDIEAEQAVLGSIIFDNSNINEVAAIITPNSFFEESHKHIYRAILELVEKNQPIDEILLGDQLKAFKKLEDIGGYYYLAELVECAPSAGNVVYYAHIIKEHKLLRDLIETTADIGRKSRDPQQSVSALLSEAEDKILEIANSRHGGDIKHIKEVLVNNFNELEELSKNKDDIIGIPTGFEKIDKMTCGLNPADFIIIAGRPSMGKTSVALNIASHVGINHGPVYIVSREMKNEKLTKRMLASVGRINSHFLKTGNSNGREEWDRLASATQKLSGADIYMSDKVRTIDEIVYSARSLHRRLPKGLKLFVVDYIGLIESLDEKYREREIAKISLKLKGLANDLNIPVIALSQLNRSLESRTNKRPQMSDLRESGSLEQDTDIIMFIYRDDVYKIREDPNYIETGIAEIDIAKNRDGPTGVVELTFQGKYTKFSNITSYTDIRQPKNNPKHWQNK